MNEGRISLEVHAQRLPASQSLQEHVSFPP
jgi:hypothetical protein